MTKRMLIDDTHPEETRVVIVEGNKIEDVEFETAHRKQIKGNIYLAKVMRVEPSLQAAFVDYGGNKHGFLAFGEIHPDYYNMSEEALNEIDKEIEDIIENKKQQNKDREEQRERQRVERENARLESLAKRAAEDALKAQANTEDKPTVDTKEKTQKNTVVEKNVAEASQKPEEKSEEVNAEASVSATAEDNSSEEASSEEGDNRAVKKRHAKKRYKKYRKPAAELKVMAESTGVEDEIISEKVRNKHDNMNDDDIDDDDDDDDENDLDFELTRKLLKVRKLYHKSNIQEVIKEGQVLLVQVVKEERGNKGAALTTYLSLAGRYCVFMPNRIKSGGVSRKITNAGDRKRLKSIVKELPLTADMSMIVRTAGEEKSKPDIVRDYNYLIRSWNQVRIDSLRNKAPALIHEEGNLIKRALRDMYTKEISEIIVDGERAYKTARDFTKILSPHNLKKLKSCKTNDIPLFQRFQVETQLDKLHDSNVQLSSGGYLVINPTEALVAIDVNSGRATKEKDLEETALKTNLEAADEIAKQLKLRNLAGLIVIDFIDMDEQKNNSAVEKRMKEALKNDRARIQIGKMSCFGLLEISRQRMHSSFLESNYQVCPCCQGKGMIRSIESGAVLILRSVEEEGIKNRSSKVIISVPTETAIYLLNQKRNNLVALENRYKMNIVISADDTIKNIADYKIERIKAVKSAENEPVETPPENRTENRAERADNRSENRYENRADNRAERAERPEPVRQPARQPFSNNAPQPAAQTAPQTVSEVNETANEEVISENQEQTADNNSFDKHRNNRGNRRRDRRNRHHHKDKPQQRNFDNHKYENNNGAHKERSEAVILYNSHGDDGSQEKDGKQKSTWWKKLIKG